MWTNDEKRKWGLILFSGCICLYASRVLISNTSQHLVEELHWNHKQLGMVMSIFFWGYMLTQYLGGLTSDRYGGDTVIFYSTSAWSIITLIYVWLPNLIEMFDYEFTSTQDPTISPLPEDAALARQTSSKDERIYVAFILCRFLQGCAQGFFYPSIASLLSRKVDPRKKQLIFAFITSGSHMGTLLCGFFGSYISENYGWRLAFHLTGCLTLFWAMGIQTQIKKAEKYIPIGEIDAERVHKPTNDKVDFWLVFSSPQFLAVMWANIVYSNTFYILLNWMPTYFHDNYPAAKSWVFNFFPWLIISPSVVLGGLIAEKMSRDGFKTIHIRKLLNTATLLGTSIFLNLLHFFDDYTTCLVLMALAIAFCGFHNSGILMNAQEIANKNCGQVYGILSAIGTIPGFCSVYFTGYIIDTTHDWSFVFRITGLLNVSGWIIYTIYGSVNPIFNDKKQKADYY